MVLSPGIGLLEAYILDEEVLTSGDEPLLDRCIPEVDVD